MGIGSESFRKAKESAKVGETGKYAVDSRGNVRSAEEINKEREDKLDMPNQKPEDM